MDRSTGVNRRKFIKQVIYGGLGATTFLNGPALFAKHKKSPTNVLFIIADDLRPQLGCYGEKQMVTPNIDRLASQGIVFEHAYCQQALCAPSRASMLSGLRPDATGVHGLKTRLSDTLPDHITLPRYFKENGYETLSLGKVYHNTGDDPKAWSIKPLRIKSPLYATGPGLQSVQENRKLHPDLKWPFGVPTEIAAGPDNSYNDGRLTDQVVAELNRVKDRPFFLFAGYSKPHLPFNAPRKYWDMYDPGKIKLPANPFPPKGITPYTQGDYAELRLFYGIPTAPNPVPEEQARHLLHGYYACVSFLDAQVGRLLAELDRLKLRENTIVLLWGDNGLKLGEHGSWSKSTNFEIDTRVPLIVSAPGLGSAGKHTTALVESIDIYPTLCELCGLKSPAPVCQGTSFAPLLSHPDRTFKKAAYSQYPRYLTPRIMGYSVRTERYRYTEWRNVASGQVLARELYDHLVDPGENINIAGFPAYVAAIIELEQILKHQNFSRGKY